jgi:hypothetical protein
MSSGKIALILQEGIDRRDAEIKALREGLRKEMTRWHWQEFIIGIGLALVALVVAIVVACGHKYV